MDYLLLVYMIQPLQHLLKPAKDKDFLQVLPALTRSLYRHTQITIFSTLHHKRQPPRIGTRTYPPALDILDDTLVPQALQDLNFFQSPQTALCI